MDTEIYYFSGTGNSLHVAKELQSRIPGTRLLPIVSLLDRERVEAQAETVGLVFPQYASTLPKIMAGFVQKLDLHSAQYIFAIATRGGTDCHAFEELDQLLGENGRRLDAFFVLQMPSGSSPLVASFPQRINHERIARLEAEMQKKLDTIQRIVVAQEVSRSEDLRGTTVPPDWLVPFMPLIQALRPVLHRLGKFAESNFGFYFDARCTGCSLCEKVCPAQRIKMAAERPAWQKEVPCYGCLACLNYCPEQSIQVKSTWYLKSFTTQNGRYHHPGITAKDIANQKTTP